MAWENCYVNLNSDSTGSFYTGDIVTGSVVLEFKRTQKIEQIAFTVNGISKAQWTRPSPTMPHIKFYSEKKKVLYIEIDLFEDIQGKTLSPGVYTYPFHFVLPEDLPSSFESSIAKVEYHIKIKSEGMCSHKKIVSFVVLGNVNINHIERYLEPYCQEIHKTCFNMDKLTFYVKTLTGFSSNQKIPFEIKVDNERNVRILKISVALIQKLRYSIREGYADEERKMCKAAHLNFSNTKEEICAFHIDIPHVIPSSLHIRQPMIDISYVFRIAVKLLFHTNIYEDIPVTVATVPVIHYDFNEFNK